MLHVFLWPHVCLICCCWSLCHESVLVLTAAVYSPHTVLHTPLRVTERRFFPVSQLVSEWRVKFHNGFQTPFAIRVYILKPSVTDISTSLCCDLCSFQVIQQFTELCPFSRSFIFTQGYHQPTNSENILASCTKNNVLKVKKIDCLFIVNIIEHRSTAHTEVSFTPNRFLLVNMANSSDKLELIAKSVWVNLSLLHENSRMSKFVYWKAGLHWIEK